MMGNYRKLVLSLLICGLLPLGSSAKDKEAKVHDAGLGFSFSSGQSIFFTRATNPFKTNHTYLSGGIHLEEEGLGVTYYNYYLGQYERRSEQTYFLELGGGWRHLWFQDKLAGGFFPHTVIEGGASGYFAQFGRLRNLFKATSLRWVPYVQAGIGASIYTGTIIYRIEMGYLSTLPTLDEDVFPKYQGAFLKVIASSGQKPR
ncbi:MAG: hypothetical protein JSU61_03250 [Fidelibacterota bacterium]|nr:MAG: hypothetical protein JSU61_03250 [Candidatus Neomarinimicrobiota bacterium]